MISSHCGCSGLGQTEITGSAIGPDFSNIDGTLASDIGGAPSIDWNSIVQGGVKTAEQIALQQTVPAGTYMQQTPYGTIRYQQPTSPPTIPGLALPGLSLPTGFSMGTILLIGGVVLAVALASGRH